MTWQGLYECIPPVYTEHVGRQLLAHLRQPCPSCRVNPAQDSPPYVCRSCEREDDRARRLTRSTSSRSPPSSTHPGESSDSARGDTTTLAARPRRVPAGHAHRGQGQDRQRGHLLLQVRRPSGHRPHRHPVLYAHGLSFSATPGAPSRAPTSWSGCSVTSRASPTRAPCPLNGRSAQEIGSAITYGRRYLLGCLTGIVTDDDEDGQIANRTTAPHPRRAQPGGAPEPAPRRPSRRRGMANHTEWDPDAMRPTTSSRPPSRWTTPPPPTSRTTQGAS